MYEVCHLLLFLHAPRDAPRYLGHAMEAWLGDAPIYSKYFNVDPTQDPRLVAAVSGGEYGACHFGGRGC